MTAEQDKVFNTFNISIVGKDKGMLSVGEFERFAEYSYAVTKQYKRNFKFVLKNKKTFEAVCGEFGLCEDSELKSMAKQAAGRKTLGNRKRRARFINPPKHEYDEDFLFTVFERKSLFDDYKPSFDSVLARLEAERLEKKRQEQLAQVRRKQKQQQQRAEAERKEHEVRLQQAIEEEKKIKRKDRIKQIIGIAVVILLGILYILIKIL